ncbi:GNAT family N-acetyltransferase [Streptomyces sp. ISL-112]|uniref:GNAT family N-acetyltransferase n=1 Tax=unclassified Streptomyces TaxID=2593676 RepID=UPI001BEC70D9|nr:MULTISPECIES: GNAT family protein [unclassified Streptomyces]MBT2427432.1 GNAT family N-acetyltransferase [Streptomyces sp. ISL-112]MBT2464467.1 GNAT family N-acetyltransferase [Streptomyces sp. ISL-63]
MNDDEEAAPYAARERFWRCESLAFTPMEPGDAELIQHWRADPVAAREIGVWPGPLHELHERLVSYVEDRDRDDFLILLADDTPIGHTALHSQDFADGTAEAFLLLAPEHRGKGHAAAALAALTDLAFGELPLHRLEAVTHTENAAALATLKGAGFTQEGVRRSSCLHRGRRHDNALLALLRTEWEAQTRPRSWDHV